MAAIKKTARTSVFSDPSLALNSLFGEILDWMLAPLLLVWPISIAVTHHVAEEIANQPYDAVLAEQLVKVVHNLTITPEGITVRLPRSQADMADDGDADKQYYQLAIAGGELLAGDKEIPAVSVIDNRGAPGEVQFRSGSVMGERVRIAYRFLPLQGMRGPCWCRSPKRASSATSCHRGSFPACCCRSSSSFRWRRYSSGWA